MTTTWTTPTRTKLQLGLKPADTVDDYWLDACVRAANQFVDDTRHGTPPAGGWTVDDRTALGASMLAARWYSRRGTGDVSGFVELGGPAPAVDRDIEMQLRIGRHQPPAVA